jgi:hypothetical protein
MVHWLMTFLGDSHEIKYRAGNRKGIHIDAKGRVIKCHDDEFEVEVLEIYSSNLPGNQKLKIGEKHKVPIAAVYDIDGEPFQI